MHALTSQLNAPAFGPIRHSLGRAAARLRAADERYYLARELERLDDRLLRDMGVTRTEALREARRLRQP
jgi:uncharacterized protein YjiS (DUF1127 family)